MRNIILTGFGAAGKTTIGRYLAHRFDRQFFDVNEEITKKTGQHHDQYIQKAGWEAYRKVEHEIVKQLQREENAVIATGGGTLLDEANSDALQHNGTLFFIDVPFEELVRRTHARLDRPVANAWNVEELRQKYDERKPSYLQGVRVDVNGFNPEESADRVMEAIFEQAFPRPPYELWMRRAYLSFIERQELTTILRPGARLRPAPKGVSPGEKARMRILAVPGTDHTLPIFDDYACTVKIESVEVKTISNLSGEDFQGQSPDVTSRQTAKIHLGLIYNREFTDKDIVSLIRFGYVTHPS